jgi:hypothetical protein
MCIYVNVDMYIYMYIFKYTHLVKISIYTSHHRHILYTFFNVYNTHQQVFGVGRRIAKHKAKKAASA